MLLELRDSLPEVSNRDPEYDEQVSDTVSELRRNVNRYGLIVQTTDERERDAALAAYRLRLKCEDKVSVHQRKRVEDGKMVYEMWGVAR